MIGGKKRSGTARRRFTFSPDADAEREPPPNSPMFNKGEESVSKSKQPWWLEKKKKRKKRNTQQLRRGEREAASAGENHGFVTVGKKRKSVGTIAAILEGRKGKREGGSLRD